MSLRGVVIVASLSWASCSTATVSLNDDDAFCRQIRTLVKSADQDFSPFRGKRLIAVPDDGGGDDQVRYETSLPLPGAIACGIDSDRSDGDPLPAVYVCWFAADKDHRAVDHLTRLVTACIGQSPGDSVVTRYGREGATVDIQRKDLVASITSGRDRPVILEMSAK